MRIERHRPRLGWAAGAALAVGLAGSVWAWLGGSSCLACGGLSAGFGGKTLSVLGTAGYAGLFMLWIAGAPLVWLSSGVFAAVGIHAGLLAVMLEERAFCAPCLVAALGGGSAAAALLAMEPAHLLWAGALVAAGALATESWAIFGGTRGTGTAVPWECGPAGPQSNSRSPGQVRLVIYSRPDCGFCLELDRDVLPAVSRALGGRLRIDRRSAEPFPGLPTPTLLLEGPGGRRHFSGLPPREELERALWGLLEDPIHEAAVSKDAR